MAYTKGKREQPPVSKRFKNEVRIKPREVRNPVQLLQYFSKYVNSIRKQPNYEVDYVGQNARKVYKPKRRPVTIEGFCRYMGRGEVWFVGLMRKRGNMKPWFNALSYIKTFVNDDLLDGGMSGFFPNNIVVKYTKLDKVPTGKEFGKVKVKFQVNRAGDIGLLKDLKSKLEGNIDG